MKIEPQNEYVDKKEKRKNKKQSLKKKPYLMNK